MHPKAAVWYTYHIAEISAHRIDLSAIWRNIFMEFYEKLNEADKGKSLACLTILEGPGAGSKALWSSGGFLCAQGKEEDFKVYLDLLKNEEKTGTVTAGNGRCFCEFIANEKHLVVCGAGHISIPIIKIGKMLGFHITVIDDRLSFANNAAAAGADVVLCKPFHQALSEIEGSAGHYFVIVTRGHRYDQECLYEITGKKNAYIGMIGSRARVKLVMEYLEEQGIKKELLDAVYTPIGLKINAQTPEEIAVAIMAEIIQVKNTNKTGFGFPKDILEALTAEKSPELPMSLVTVISKKGPAPRDVSTKMLVRLDGTCVGTIGGGCVEAEVCSIAREVARDRQPVLKKVDLTTENAEDEGMVCGGVIEVYIEPVLY